MQEDLNQNRQNSGEA
jgi:hypothetical protein